jgi:hypothetical protein
MTSLLSLLSLSVLALPLLFAAPLGEGRLGPSSMASARISLDVAPRMQAEIVNVNHRDTKAHKSSIVCLSMNEDISRYTLRPASERNMFKLRGSGAARDISYEVFRDSAPLVSKSSIRRTLLRTSNSLCGAKGSAISVHVDETALASAPAGTYSDTLLLYAEPI